MLKLEEITKHPVFSKQFENKLLFSNHENDVSISYKSTYTLKYVIEGTKYYNYNNQDIKVSKNQYVILNHDSKITTEAKKGTKGLSFFLSPTLVNEIYNYNTNTNSNPRFLEVTQKKSNSDLGLLLDKIALLYQNEQPIFMQQKDDLFIHLAETIVTKQMNIDNKFRALNIVKHNTKKELFKLIEVSKEYLNDNVSENISLDLISKDVGISKYYLHRLFTEINGNSPLQYLTLLRLKKAKDRLKYSEDSIFEIAISCGFDNTPYFSNIFKKYIGLSPSEYRNLF